MDPSILRFLDARDRCGGQARELAVGKAALRFEGLSDDQAAALARTWGPFFGPPSGREVVRVVEVTDAGPGGWLDDPRPDELYRVEPLVAPQAALTLSYAFALGNSEETGWRVALARDSFEPAAQSLENAARVLAARLAGEAGGFAMHAAGVLREGRAWLLAGPSGSGKSTAARLVEPAESLGDDFALVLPDGDGGWLAPPLPFDNRARIVARPDGDLHPVAGVWRLFHDRTTRVERPDGLIAVTSLSSCAALPWAMPDLAGPVVENIGRFCESGRFGHLYFSPAGGVWEAIRGSLPALD